MALKRLLPLGPLITVLLVTSAAQAQRVTGQVRYADTNQAAFNVSVHCNGTGTNQIQQTDRSGRFTCTLGSPGRFSVRVDADGYLPEEQSGNAPDTNSSEYLFFRLLPKAGPKTATRTVPVIDASVPPEARKAYEKGVEAIGSGNKDRIEEGARQLEKAVTAYPKFLEALVHLGAAYMDLQQWDKAEPVFKKALEIEPNTANALFALGEIYLRQKKTEEAEKVLLQGLKINDKSAAAHLTLARTYWEVASKIKDETLAKPPLEKAYHQVNQSIILDPKVAHAHLVKGNLLLRVRRAADAQREYEEYLRLDPKGPFAEQSRVIVEKIKKALATEEKKP